MKEKNPYNNVGISFASEVEILERGKARMRELGIRSFSEYVKQLIKYDLGMPNYISEYIAKKAKSRAEILISETKSTAHNQKRKGV